ncbi:penicillin acylase family protein [Curvibacter sp. APW13]|uniref:penicillin acylase family protein n=1 Tax=Curvibacter sp. APW13 TaxID=3077236 RepID=UPI0028DE50B9|nr:penicillin acylase family protein [Curvibacter sp. APW13]MDT8990007.1 penicillin acylase family protein [Curvibacter sp. APW13]
MQWLKRLVWTLLALALLALSVVVVYVVRAAPQLDGRLPVAGVLAPVELRRDGADVTHIRAASDRDAWFALGWTHAQERGWQLEFNRRVLRGELSALFGEATLDTDKLMRTLGIVQAAQRQWAGLPDSAKAALLAYSEGINAFHAGNTRPLAAEFQLLKVRPGRWEPVDSLGWSIMMALDLGGNWGNEFARLSAAQALDNQRLWELFPPYPGEKPAASADLSTLYRELGVYRQPVATAGATKNEAAHAVNMRATGQNAGVDALQMAAWSQDFSNGMGTVDGKGSNNWVVSGKRTVSGKPLLANDPHLGLNAPAIWYFAHLEAPGLNAIGATLPGLPFVVLGRTQGVAWGFTNTGPDVQDLYLEYIHPENPKLYRAPDINGHPAWESFKTREETIAVKGKPAVHITVRETRHGPVLSDVQKSHAELLDTSRFVLALRWTALDADNHTVVAGLEGNRAQTVGELTEAFKRYHSPMQNVVMADTKGRIAYQAFGKVPLRKPANDIRGVAPSPGWDAKYDWQGWIAADDTPQDDGAKGWVATANQRITPPGYPHFMGQDWGVPYRFERIEELLAQRSRHDVHSMQAIQADVRSAAALRILPFLQKAQGSHPLAAQAQALLKDFDGQMRADQAAPLIVVAWADELTRALVTPRLGELRMKALYGKRQFRPLLEMALERNDSFWCGDKGCAVQSSAALDRALERLVRAYGKDMTRWQWGQAHAARSVHNPFDKVGALAPLFNVVTPTGGDGFTVNVGQYWLNDEKYPFANRHAASLRAVYDLSNLENSQFIYQTGQSGAPFYGRYADMAEQWGEGKYRPLQLQPTTVDHYLKLMPR